MCSADPRDRNGPRPESGTCGTRKGPVLLLLAHCAFIFLCSAYLYQAGLALHATRFWWVGQGMIVLFILLVGGLVSYQLVRALSRRRYAHLLFLVIVVLSLFPTYFSLDRPMQRFHLLLFGVLGMLTFRVLSPRRYTLRFYLWGLNIVLAVSLLDEILQGFVPGRYYDVCDIGINLFAGTIGLLAMRTLDLDAPLSLHPQPRSGHTSPAGRAPLVDLHVYPADILLVALPAACVLLFDAAVTKSVEVGDLAGRWVAEASGGLEVRIDPDAEVWVKGPDCAARGRAVLEGNALDGFRVAFHETWGDDWDPERDAATACAQPFRRAISLRRQGGDGLYLWRDDLGRLDRAP